MKSNDFPPNTNPHIFSLIAVAVGYACVGNYTTNEQNSIGNWIILVGQYILTHAAQQQLIEGRRPNTNKEKQNDIDLLLSALKKIEEELKKFK